MKLNIDQVKWASERRQGAAPALLKELLIKQKATCALSKVKMIFDLSERKPKPGKGNGCHPLSPAVDHIKPGDDKGGYQIICYALNDLKGHLPADCFAELKRTKAWKRLMKKWKEQAARGRHDREAFRKLIRPGNGGQKYQSTASPSAHSRKRNGKLRRTQRNRIK